MSSSPPPQALLNGAIEFFPPLAEYNLVSVDSRSPPTTPTHPIRGVLHEVHEVGDGNDSSTHGHDHNFKGHESDGSSEASAPRCLIPNSSADWEAKKSIIKEYYMEQNLILNDVIAIMQEQHRFKATARMYKGQFAKWKWTKYNKSGKPGTTKPPCSRTARRKGVVARSESRDAERAPRDCHPPKQYLTTQEYLPCQEYHSSTSPSLLPLLYQNDEAFQLEVALSAYSAYISAWCQRKTPWRTEPYPGGAAARKVSILQQFNVAFNHFNYGRSEKGGNALRQAFRKVEDAVANELDVEAIWDCCLAVPQLALTRGWADILVMFTEYLYEIASVKKPGHPITQIAMNIYRLARQSDKCALQSYIAHGWGLWVNLVTQLRGSQDYVTIHLKRGYVILMNPEMSIVATLLEDFEGSVRSSLATEGEVNTTNRILELEQLLVRMYIPLFSAESTIRARVMLSGVVQRLRDKHGNKNVPQPCWDYVDRYEFFSAHHFLASIEDHMGEHEKAADYRRRSLESPKDRFWYQTAQRLCDYLQSQPQSLDRVEEAETILRQTRELTWLTD